LAVKDNNMGFHYKKNIGKGYQMKHGNRAFKMGPVAQEVNNAVGSDISSNDELFQKMEQYNQYKDYHSAENRPAFDWKNPVSSYIDIVKYNYNSPVNPHMTQGSGALELVGGRGGLKLLSGGMAKFFGKHAAKKAIDTR
tara:strand:+ start:310 stop:726 length:417 start_codon:yes stop_codon:yes gene_type:complete